jgi:hypothetical protein
MGAGNEHSVYAQHQWYFDEKRDNICPREAFTRDLCEELNLWLVMGDQVVIALDSNDDMKQGMVEKAFCGRNLCKVIMEWHGQNAPPMTDNGLRVINGIWVTPLIRIKQGGYLVGGEAMPQTNHRVLWIDITYKSMYGHTLPPIICPIAKWLKLLDPRIVQRYIKTYHEWIETHQLDILAFDLQHRSTYPLDPQMAEMYEWLDEMKMKGIALADKTCQKLCMGGVLWCPLLQTL